MSFNVIFLGLLLQPSAVVMANKCLRAVFYLWKYLFKVEQISDRITSISPMKETLSQAEW